MDSIELEFNNNVEPIQGREPHIIVMSKVESDFVDTELIRLRSMKVVEKLDKKPKGAWVSNIFLRPKKDGSFRLILNLKPLNMSK